MCKYIKVKIDDVTSSDDIVNEICIQDKLQAHENIENCTARVVHK
jgi:hypothetical protein